MTDGENMLERRKGLMEVIAWAAINVAERHPDLRGPWRFDEAELQKMAAGARHYLRTASIPNEEGEGK